MPLSYDIETGSGLQLIDIDLTTSGDDVLGSITRIGFLLTNDDGEDNTEVLGQGSFDAQGPVTEFTTPVISEYAMITEAQSVGSVTVSSTSVDRYFLRVVHQFETVGVYILRVYFEDTLGRRSFIREPVRVAVGDGVN